MRNLSFSGFIGTVIYFFFLSNLSFVFLKKLLFYSFIKTFSYLYSFFVYFDSKLPFLLDLLKNRLVGMTRRSPVLETSKRKSPSGLKHRQCQPCCSSPHDLGEGKGTWWHPLSREQLSQIQSPDLEGCSSCSCSLLPCSWSFSRSRWEIRASLEPQLSKAKVPTSNLLSPGLEEIWTSWKSRSEVDAAPGAAHIINLVHKIY